jgi:hypothetical protein
MKHPLQQARRLLEALRPYDLDALDNRDDRLAAARR